MTSRDYIDQLITFIISEMRKRTQAGELATPAILATADFSEAARKGLDGICDVFSWNKPTQTDFENYLATAITEFRINNPVDVLASASLKKSRAESWLTEERYKQIIPNYTDRYFRYLRKIQRPAAVIDETYRASKKILGKMGDPASPQEFFVKGLVVGSVQSGKTTNFNAVINRSVDAGYELIIVLSGIMEDLRRQTQLRIEKEVAGYGIVDELTEKKDFKGVGEIMKFGILGNSSVHQVVLPTSHKVDFRKTLREAEFSLNHKNILICKKNTSVLKNLILWLQDYLSQNRDKHNIPFLIVDDEADNASLNNMGAEGRDYASKINGHIRALLGLFNRKTYLGYTATPFANVLQDRNDVPLKKWEVDYKEKGEKKIKEFDLENNLFPEDFIELLFPPSNYIGAKHFFETRIEEIQKIEPLIPPPIDDVHTAFPLKIDRGNGKLTAATQRDEYPTHIPDSLKEAVQCFILSIAVRLSRKAAMVNSRLYNPHHTMLIHISRFTTWQNRTKTLLEDHVTTLTSKLNTDIPSDPGSIYAEFERIWYKYYAHVIENIRTYLPADYEDEFLIPKTFEEIKPLLIEAVKGVEVKAVNSKSTDVLIYPDKAERKYIAIGGNKLSRGFTLEGLTINYFVRNTDYADTLLQMGRWFGYRPGYLDCCKLFTTADSINKFDRITYTIEELEQTFRRMSVDGARPVDFDIWVKSHPRVLKITRAAIMRNTELVKVSYSGEIEQSTKFDINKQRIEKAWSAFTVKNQNIAWNRDPRGFFIHKTDSHGLFEFLDMENSFFDFDLPGVKEYIRLCVEEGKLTNWTIAVKMNEHAPEKVLLNKDRSLLPGDMYLTIRRGPKAKREETSRAMLLKENIFKASGRSANIVAAGEDFALTLDDEGVKKAKEAFRKRKTAEFIKENKLSADAAKEKAAKITSIPDKEFRAQMEERDGILVIYLIDLEKVFESEKNKPDDGLMGYAKSRDLDLKIPLIGYALGFPRVSGEIGGTYVHYREEESDEDEFNEELTDEENA